MVNLLSLTTHLFETYPLYTSLSALLVILVTKRRIDYWRRNPRNLPLPPGPKGYPLIGNLFDAPIEKPWLVYNEWAKVYGDMIYFEVLGQRFLILNSLEKIEDLFEKRSFNYSDRMRMPMVLELMDWYYNMAMLPYGTWWRRHRRTFNEHFHATAVWKYQPTQAREARAFLSRLLTSPENFLHHVRHTFAATIMSIAYGVRVKGPDDPYILNAEAALYGLAEAGIPGTFLVDFVPLLKYVPSWFPGATFKRKADRWNKINKEVYRKPFEYVEEQMKKGTAAPCLASTLIQLLPDEEDPLREEERKIAMNVSAVTYVAGADTTVSAVQCFFLAMTMYPEVQKKAQAEIDGVIGNGRLPEFSDRQALPYINALVKESMRWQSIIPLAVGHMASEDDEYNGYFIPKGTVVLGNGWAILHDPAVFKDPLEYQPERYLKNGQLDPNVRQPDTGAFGFGRRMCPGRHMSDNSLYAIVSSVLAVYNISAPLDEQGKPVEMKAEVTSGLLSYPVPFKCDIKPRSLVAEVLIRDSIMADN
ncbi:cytochrome P450 [Pholiota conissans]|uniref:Cytochrome P450 n=1 Tax=Pholiota conissans TaxID=109636 RepID=A0A9P5Z2J5_9AGAR|nr:cytochrome P450 [Pholiota conissans]